MFLVSAHRNEENKQAYTIQCMHLSFFLNANFKTFMYPFFFSATWLGNEKQFRKRQMKQRLCYPVAFSEALQICSTLLC